MLKRQRTFRVSRPVDLKLEPVSDEVKQERKAWCERQTTYLNNSRSRAVLKNES